MTQLLHDKRILAHLVVHQGRRYALSLAEAYLDTDNLWCVRITPYQGETHSTVFIDGTLSITDGDGNFFTDHATEPPVFWNEK